MQQQTYYIHNTTRSIHTNATRRALPSPECSTKNLFLAGGLIRLVRGRPFPVTETFLRNHLAEVQDKERKGLIRVYDSQNRRVEIPTLRVLSVQEPVVKEAEQEAETIQVIPEPEPIGIEAISSSTVEAPFEIPYVEEPAPQEEVSYGGRRKRR